MFHVILLSSLQIKQSIRLMTVAKRSTIRTLVPLMTCQAFTCKSLFFKSWCFNEIKKLHHDWHYDSNLLRQKCHESEVFLKRKEPFVLMASLWITCEREDWENVLKKLLFNVHCIILHATQNTNDCLRRKKHMTWRGRLCDASMTLQSRVVTSLTSKTGILQSK